MNYWKLLAVLVLLLCFAFTGAVSAADHLSISGSILPAAPNVDFAGTPTSGAHPFTVVFTATNTGGPVNTWAWTISGTQGTDYQYVDSTTAASQNPHVQFLNPGSYDVSLTATNAGGSSVKTRAGYITVNPSVDLTIAGAVDTVPSSAIFAKETNTVTVAGVKNQGTDSASNVVVSLYASDVGGGATPVASTTITSLAGGATASTITFTDPTIRPAEGTVTYTAKVDPDNLIAETNEANNNLASAAKPLKYNGYKGKRYWDPVSDIATRKTFDLNGDVIYSTQPASSYKGVGWTGRTETWAGTDLPVPSSGTVQKVYLYVSYNWDLTPGGVPSITTTFNGNPITLGTPYIDKSNFGTYAENKYGLYPAIDVTSLFVNGGTNTLVMTPNSGNSNALYPSTLVVVYSDPTRTRKQIFINEECDELAASQPSYGTTADEATAYAPFTGMTIDTGSVQSATLSSFAGSAGPNEGNLLFNGASVATNAWQGTSSTASAQSFNVKSYLTSTGNVAGIQGTQSGGMVALQQVLVVEYTAAPPVATFTWSPNSPDRGTSVNFDASTSTGIISGYAWDFGDGNTGSGKTASHTYTTAGDKTVQLTVTGPGGSNSATHTVHVKEPAPIIDFTPASANGPAPLTVNFQATNTGGAVNSWDWNFGDGTAHGSGQSVSHTYTTAGTYSVTLTATGPDYTATASKPNSISVGTATISVDVSPTGISFGTMSTAAPSAGSTTVTATPTGGTGWSVTATASNSGKMSTGTMSLVNPFQLSNDGTNYQAMTSSFNNFLQGLQGAPGSGTASVKQVINSGDQPGDYTITLTFTGGFV